MLSFPEIEVTQQHECRKGKQYKQRCKQGKQHLAPAVPLQILRIRELGIQFRVS